MVQITETRYEQPVNIRKEPPYSRVDGTDLALVTCPRAVSEQRKLSWGHQVASYVRRHNEAHPGSMYEREPEELAAHIHQENAVVLLEGDEVAYFGLSLPQFGKAEQVALGGFQLVEFANLIVSPDARNEGIGYRGTIEQFRHLHKRWNGLGVGYLTTENPVLQHIYEKENPDGGQFMESVDWEEFPYLAGLTCSYSALGNGSGHECEAKRRPPEWLHDENPSLIEEGQIPCTLMISPRETGYAFQRMARKVHASRGGEPVEINPGNRIATDDVLRVYSFYQSLSIHE